MTSPRFTVVIPAYNEGNAIVACLDQILVGLRSSCEVLIVYDRVADTTAAPVAFYATKDDRVRGVLNSVGAGPAGAILTGVRHAQAPVVVVTMADGSDQVNQIEELVCLIEEGAVVAAASRYMAGGTQNGGPWLKRTLSRAAGTSLYLLAGVGTHDATNSFKAYSKTFLEEAGVDSCAGFEMGIEMVAKAKRRQARVAEIPTAWVDRSAGQSNFKMRRWLPHYLRWYVVAVLAHHSVSTSPVARL